MRNKNFIILIIGQIISLIASCGLRFVLSLQILNLTDSSILFSVILVLGSLSAILSPKILGVLSNKVNKKLLIVSIDICCVVILIIFGITLNENKGVKKILILGVFTNLVIAAFFMIIVTYIAFNKLFLSEFLYVFLECSVVFIDDNIKKDS